MPEPRGDPPPRNGVADEDAVLGAARLPRHAAPGQARRVATDRSRTRQRWVIFPGLQTLDWRKGIKIWYLTGWIP